MRHNSSVKLYLTHRNKIVVSILHLITWIISHVNKSMEFKNMKNAIHIDEKLFRIMKGRETFYLARNELKPHLTIKSKTFIAKVMFLNAVARLRYNPNIILFFMVNYNIRNMASFKSRGTKKFDYKISRNLSNETIDGHW